MSNGDIPKVSWRRLDDYSKKDVEYKNQARELLCKELGFEPPVYISSISELSIRALLRHKVSEEELQENVGKQAHFIKKIIPEYAPGLMHLINKS